MTDDTHLEVVLSKREKRLYKWLLSHFGEDPDEYLSARLLECPPEHYADLADMFAAVSAEELAALWDGDDADEDLPDMADAFMRKIGRKLSEQDLTDAAQAEMDSRGPLGSYYDHE